MRGVLGETFIDFPAPDNKSEAEMLAYTEKFLKKWQGDALIHAAPAPHSIYTCSEKTIQDAAALAKKYHTPLLMHVSEMKKEWEDSEKQNGTSPVQYLEKIGVLGPDLIAAHCIFVDEADRKLPGRAASGVRTQSVEQHDDRKRRVSRAGDAGGGYRGGAGNGWPGGE